MPVLRAAVPGLAHGAARRACCGPGRLSRAAVPAHAVDLCEAESLVPRPSTVQLNAGGFSAPGSEFHAETALTDSSGSAWSASSLYFHPASQQPLAESFW